MDTIKMPLSRRGAGAARLRVGAPMRVQRVCFYFFCRSTLLRSLAYVRSSFFIFSLAALAGK